MQVTAGSFGDFQDALEQKLGRELGTGGGGGSTDVPEPPSIALFALRLIGIAGLYRRLRA